MKNRREFLATVGAAGAASIVAGSVGAGSALPLESREKLAIDGGTPVRKTQLRYQPYGPQFYDDVEKRELIDVLESKKLLSAGGETTPRSSSSRKRTRPTSASSMPSA